MVINNNSQIEREGPVLEIVKVEFQPFFDRGIAAPAIHLGPPGDTDLQCVAMIVEIHLFQKFVYEMWAPRPGGCPLIFPFEI